MDRWQAIHNFWSGFGVNAYDEGTVPDDATFPRITYSVSVDNFGQPVTTYANLWYRTTSWKDISNKADEIEYAITHMRPPAIKIDGGRMLITKGTPFAQRIADPDTTIRRMYFNVNVEYLVN